jgi:hypothetical protein
MVSVLIEADMLREGLDQHLLVLRAAAHQRAARQEDAQLAPG